MRLRSSSRSDLEGHMELKRFSSPSSSRSKIANGCFRSLTISSPLSRPCRASRSILGVEPGSEREARFAIVSPYGPETEPPTLPVATGALALPLHASRNPTDPGLVALRQVGAAKLFRLGIGGCGCIRFRGGTCRRERQRRSQRLGPRKNAAHLRGCGMTRDATIVARHAWSSGLGDRSSGLLPIRGHRPCARATRGLRNRGTACEKQERACGTAPRNE